VCNTVKKEKRKHIVFFINTFVSNILYKQRKELIFDSFVLIFYVKSNGNSLVRKPQVLKARDY